MTEGSTDFDRWIEDRGPDWVTETLSAWVSERRLARIEQVLAHRLQGVTVVLVRLYDPHNGAAVLRTAEGMGLQDVHAVEAADQPFRASPKVTIGCDKWLDVHRHADMATCRRVLVEQDFELWGAVVGATRAVTDIPHDRKVALVFGNERDGLSDEERALCDAEFRLPMWGFSESYNLSVSVGMSLHHVVPRYRGRLDGTGDLPEDRKARLRALWLYRSVRGADAILRRANQEGIS